MVDMQTRYLGLDLQNPIVVSSCGLTGTAKGIHQCVEAGAGAVVVKSLFEEQIDAEIDEGRETGELSVHPEASEYLEQMGKQLGPSDYLSLIAQAKAENSVPIIASVNCITGEWWVNYARQLEKAGADAIELNVSLMPRSRGDSSETIEKRYLAVVESVRKRVSIPVSVKIGPYFTSLPALAHALCNAGTHGLVLFNRFYQLDIDIDARVVTPGYQFSTVHEIYQPLRWISILRDQVSCDLAGSTGVHTGKEAVKLLLAGATAVQICSTIYTNGLQQIGTILGELESWMEHHGYQSLDQFRGSITQASSGNPAAFERLQYIKALTGIN
ncbi:MAG: dihydroorotate dehydrogenase-like protein [Spirochaetaceae bacterium]|nr:MAG: dihydroorotate dehydrogenase-like protein [Spirochaetaceae bacterium]